MHCGSLVTLISVAPPKCLGKVSKSQGIHSLVSLHLHSEVPGRKFSSSKCLGNSKTSFTLKEICLWYNHVILLASNQVSDGEYSSYLYQRRKKTALDRNIIYMHISSFTENHIYLSNSGPFELINSAERRQVLKLGIATKACSLNKPATVFFQI